jgi:hypothetical protein
MALPVKIEYRVGVQTPPETIWAIVSDINGYAAWNPLYTRSEGEVQFDAVLNLEVALPGEAPRTIRATVVDWTPYEQIIWRVSLFAGLLRTTRYIEIEKLGDENCIFSNGEIFEGPMIRFLTRKARRAVKAGFTLMGEAVRDKAEAAFRSSQDAAISGPS